MTDDRKAGILADGHLSVRECARKHGTSPATVHRIREEFKRGAKAVSEHPETKKQAENFLEVADRVLAAVGEMVRKAANDPDAWKDPKMFHAICGGAKIIGDAATQVRVIDVRRDSVGTAFDAPSGVAEEVSERAFDA